MEDSTLLAIIPARGNSKRFPGKNLANLAGKPLITHTIEAAKRSGVFDEICVTSDNKDILAIAETFGATPLIRPDELAEDEVALAPVCLQVLEELRNKGKDFDAVALLQPTAPLRTEEDIRKAYEIFRTTQCNAVLSVFKSPHPPQRTLVIENNILKPSVGADMEKQSQEFQSLYMSNGAINIIKADVFISEKTFFVEHAAPYILDDSHAIDIDDVLQLKWAEFLLSENS